MIDLWRRTGLALALLIVPFVPGATTPSPVEHPAPRVDEAPTSALAVQLARKQGSDVVAADLTTETRTVTAHPDGTMSARIASMPVRVSRDGGWVDVDTTLVRRPDGTVGPKAAPAEYAFSGGGKSLPLLKFAVAGGHVAYSWPGALPAPQLDGSLATYKDVFPGVDLTLRAERTGYVKQLIVHSAEAARHPGLAKIRLGLSAYRLKVGVNGSGRTEIRDLTGKLVLAGASALMWDGGSAKGKVGLAVDGKSLSLIPDRKLLTSPAAKFPIVIDPSEHLAGRSYWAIVFSGYPDDKYWGGDGDNVGKVGACPTQWGGCNDIGVARTYYSFDTSFLSGREVIDLDYTKIKIEVNHGATCDNRNHSLYKWDGGIWDGMTWNSQPALGHVVSTAVGCSGTAVWAIRDKVQLGGFTSYAVVADNEGDTLAWRKYSHAAWMYIKFNAPPNFPEQARMQSALPVPCKWCAGKPYISSKFVNLQTYLTDPDQQDTLYAHWHVYHNGVREDIFPNVGLGSGNWHTYEANLGGFDGQEIAWYVAARDSQGKEVGWRQGPGPFIVDFTPPGAKPVVSSKVYPADNRWHGGLSVPGDFTFSANGVKDIDKYEHRLGQQSGTVNASALGGDATVTLPMVGDGPQDLIVTSIDRAGNPSGETVHRFYVRAGNGPLAQWSMEGDTKDSAFLGWRDGALLGNGSYVPGPVGSGVQLDGASGRVAVSTGLRTDISFSVSAWAKLDDLSVNKATVVSQSGTNTFAYSIEYEKWKNAWVFVFPTTDVAQPTGWEFVQASVPPVAGQWTHFAGVYDAQAKKIHFYVNGVLAGTSAHHPTWTGTGYLRIGYQDSAGSFNGFFPGAVDEVKLYDRVLSAAEVRAQVSHDNVQLGHWRFDDDPQSRTAANSVAGGADAVLNGAAKLVPGQVNGAVELNGLNDYVTTNAPVIRTDQSFTVAAWLTATQVPGSPYTHTAVSQDAVNYSGFYLGYRALEGGGAWELYVPSADADTRPADAVVRSAPGTAVAGRPAHVAAVYDAPSQQLRLYVDGVLAGSAPRNDGFHAAGAFRIGGALWQGQRTHQWHGTIDELRAYNRVVTVEELQGLVSRDAVAVARWGFDGNLAATPAAFNGRDAGHTVEYAGGQATLPEPNDLAVKLSGANSYVSANHAISPVRNFSVAAWARLDKVGSTALVISQDGNRIAPFGLHATPEGRWAFTMHGSDSDTAADPQQLVGPQVQIGAWTHLVATYNAASKRVELYVNGVSAGTRDNMRVFDHATGEVKIGYGFTGAIDDVSVWSRPLFAEEVKVMAGRDLSLIHQWRLDEPGGTRIADSVGSRSGTLSGDARFAAGRVGNAVHFDGSGDAVTTTGVDVHTDKAFTVTAWVKLGAQPGCDFSQQFQCTMTAVSLDGAHTSKFRLGHRMDDDQYQYGAWVFEMPENDQNPGMVTKASLVTRLEHLNAWVHLTGVYDPSTHVAVIYVNAVRGDEGTLNTAWHPQSGGVAIGRGKSGTAAEYWKGDVDDVRIYTGALDAKRIKAIHDSYPALDTAVPDPAPDAGHWKFHENTGTTVADASGRGRTATLKGGYSWVGGRDGYGVLLDGTSGYAETTAPALDTTRSFTATSWAYLTTNDGANRTVVGQDGNRISTFQIRYDGATKKWAVVIPKSDVDSPASQTLYSTESAAAGEWTHLAVTYDATLAQVRLYVNGTLSAAQVGVTVLPSTGPVSMGRSKWTGGPTGYFAKGIDEVRLYQTALTGGQIRHLHDKAPDVTYQSYRFDDGTTRDYSWRNNHATASGGVSYGPGISGKALVLDGASGAATSTYMGVHMRDSFSVSAWANLGRDDRTSTIISQDGMRNSGFVLQYRTGLNRWAFGQAASDADGAPMMYVASQQAPVLNQWTHVAGVYDYTARQLRIYVDGELAGVRDDVVLWVATGELVLGRSLYSGVKGQHFNGAIDEVRTSYGLPTEARLAQRGGWPAPQPTQLGRFVNAAGERYTDSTGSKPRAGYHFEAVLGRPAASGPNTTMVYACQSGTDQFSSTSAACEGATQLGEIGLIYTVVPKNLPTVPLYRCTSGADRYDTRQNTCGGTLLGHTVAYAALNRHYHDDYQEHYTTVDGTPPGYRFEGPQGYLAIAPVTGTVNLYSCLDGTDQFASTDPACGGKTVLATLGGIWAQAPSGVDSRALYRCSINGQRFTSGSSTCEGYTVEALLGHVLVNPPTTPAEF